MVFEDELKDKVLEVEQCIEKYLPQVQGYQKTIFEAMNYSLTAGGKRIRPMLMRETYRLCGGVHEAVLEPFMAAIEMIHTYSLIHDDLPALDNDDYRRGRKTCHVVYGEAMAILAGDALLNYAFETASKAFDLAETRPEFYWISKAFQVLCKKPGIYGMIGGQVVDVELSGGAVSKEVLDFIYEMKTSALIECSMMIGAILAGLPVDHVSTVEAAAKKIGIAFQIQDDVLDVTSSLEELGKPIHSDEKNEKTTYVTLMGIDEAKAQVKELSEQAITALKALPGQGNPFLEALIDQLIYRKK